MKIRRRSLFVLAGLAVLAGCQFFVVRSWAVSHVREVTGGREGEALDCTRCHGPGGAPKIEGDLQPHPSPWSLAASPDGGTLYVGCGPTNEVTVIDAASGSVERRIMLGGETGGIAVSPDGTRLAAALTDKHRIALVDLASHQVTRFVRVGREPRGLTWGPGSRRIFVGNAGSSTVSVVDAEQGKETLRVPACREPFVVVRSPDGKTIAVVSRRAELDRADQRPRAHVTLLDSATGQPRRTVAIDSCHMAEGAAFTRDGQHLLVPAILVRNLLPILQVARGWVMSSVLAVIDIETGHVVQLPLTEANEGFADPAGIAVSKEGSLAHVASAGGDEIAEIDLTWALKIAAEAKPGELDRLSQTRRYLIRRLAVGANPRDVTWVQGADGPRLAVSEHLADSVALIDPVTEARSRVSLAASLEDDAVWRGARVFHSASFTFQHHFSCRSCHPGAHTDGLTYDFDVDGVGRNIVLNRSLRGVAGTAPFKWIGLNPSLERQCGMRFAKVLSRAEVMSTEQISDMVSYLHSLPPPPPEVDAGQLGGRDTGAVERGREIFFRTHRKDGTLIPPSGRCATCHPAPLYTNRQRADVGTFAPGDGTGLFDVPHLTGGASKAPFLHDGRALTLEEIWTLPDVGDKHGVVTDLNKSDLNDLIEFLKGL